MSKRNCDKLTDLLNEKGFSLAAKWNPEKYYCDCHHFVSEYKLSVAIGKMVKLYPYIFKDKDYTQAERTRYVKYCKVLIFANTHWVDIMKAYEDLRIEELIRA